MDTKTFVTFLVSLFPFAFGILLIILDLTCYSYTPPLTVAGYFAFFIKARLPFMLPLVIFALFKMEPLILALIFKWQLWIVPTATLTALSVATDIQWSWYAPVTWAALFMAQLILYQQGTISKPFTFIFALSGSALASGLYELPYIVSILRPDLDTASGLMPFAFYIALFIYLLWHFKVKLYPRIVALAFSLVLFEWVLYWYVAPWLVRFAPIPLFLYIAWQGALEH